MKKIINFFNREQNLLIHIIATIVNVKPIVKGTIIFNISKKLLILSVISTSDTPYPTKTIPINIIKSHLFIFAPDLNHLKNSFTFITFLS